MKLFKEMKLFNWSVALILVAGMSLGLIIGAGAQTQPKAGGTLVWGLMEEPPNLDPHGSVLIPAKMIIDYVLEPLVAFDKNLRIKPLLAESWQVSEDGLTWDFKIKKGITFHNGNVMNAHSWVYSLERFKEKSPMSSTLDLIEELIAVDDYMLRMKLTQPNPRLLDLLVQSWTGVIDPEYVESMGERFGIEGINGTGPFELKEWARGEKIILSRVDTYQHGPSWRSNQGPAYLEEVEFRIIPEVSTLVAEVTIGVVDFTTGIPSSKISVVEKSPNVSVARRLQDRTYILFLNTKHDPLTDLRVRRAVAAAIDQKTIVEAAFQGNAEPAYIICPKAAVGYPLEIEEEVIKHYQPTDPEQARKLLEEAGWVDINKDGILEKDGKELRLSLWYPTDETMSLIAQIIEQQLIKFGIATEIVTVDPGTYYTMVAKGEQDMALRRSGYPLALDNVPYMCHSKNIGASNYTFYDYDLAPQIDEWFDKAGMLPTEQERYTAFAEALKLLGDACVGVPLAYPVYAFTWKTNRVGGVEDVIQHPWTPEDQTLDGLEFYIKE